MHRSRMTVQPCSARRAKTNRRRSAHAGSRLKLTDASGRCRLICQPSSRTGENLPYGMIGRIEETSASFEARSAPRSHPTKADMPPPLRKSENPSASVHPKRFSTPSLTLKFLRAGKLNPRLSKKINRPSVTFWPLSAALGKSPGHLGLPTFSVT